MFDMLDSLSWQGKPIRENTRWFVMGQICVAKAFRGQGVFDGLYTTMKTICADDFDFTVTEVAERNIRSMRAHERAGFKTLHRYEDVLTGETWRLILLEL